MKPFIFQKFTIEQSPKVFRVGTDGVLLGALSNCQNAAQILEIGAGTGLIALMIAQRNPKAKISAIDIDENAYLLAKNNFQKSPFAERMSAFLTDFKDFETEEKFDFIISNPPYFDENPSEKDTKARQRICLDFPLLISQSVKFLTEKGIFSVIIPSQFSEDFIQISKENGLFLIRKIHIFGNDKTQIKRHILEFSLTENPLKEEFFGIEKAPRQYSEQYLEATKEFHCFQKS